MEISRKMLESGLELELDVCCDRAKCVAGGAWGGECSWWCFWSDLVRSMRTDAGCARYAGCWVLLLGGSPGTLLLLCWVVLACSLLLLLQLVLAWVLVVAGEGRVSWIWGRFPGKAKEREEKKSCDHDERHRHLLDPESLMLFP
jgi:hypothetical protein